MLKGLGRKRREEREETRGKTGLGDQMGECSELGSWDLRSFILLTMDYIHTSEEHNK